MIKKCPGCGSILQYKDSSKVGYSPKKDAKLCERCFKLKNYNQKKIINLKYNNDEIIKLINSEAHNVLFITDFLNLSQKVIDVYNKIEVKNKILVINKADYIPKSINKDKYVNWIKDTYLVNDKVILVSAEKDYNMRLINNIISDNGKTYICGFTNSGKSSIINKLSHINNKTTNILTSLMPNTTLDTIKVKLDEDKYIFDTPGFTIEDDFDENLFPKNYLKPVTLQLKDNDLILINNKYYLKVNNANSFTFYMSDKIEIKKIYEKEINLNNIVKIDENSDLVINNYGFINIKNSCTIITNIKKEKYELRKSMF